ncbi:unnamed protein product [Arabidopsis halleri]
MYRTETEAKKNRTEPNRKFENNRMDTKFDNRNNRNRIGTEPKYFG